MNRYYETTNITENYAKYRPSYPSQIATYVMNFLEKQKVPSKPQLMLDIGCGSGQATQVFQPFFERIIGFDVSPEQIYQATKQNKHKNIEFLQGSATNLPVEDGSVDLMVAATAVHWFNVPAFFKEVKRVLKPSIGCLAIIGYSLPYIRLLSNDNQSASTAATKLFENIYLEGFMENSALLNIKMPYQDRYASIYDKLPFEIKERNDSFRISYEVSLADLCGLIKSTTSYENYQDKSMKKFEKSGSKNKMQRMDLTKKFSDMMFKLCNLDKKAFQVDLPIAVVEYSFFVLLGRTSI